MDIEKTWVYKAAKSAMSAIQDYLSKHPDVAAAFIAGGFLASPAGKTLTKGIFTKIIPMLAKAEVEMTKASAKLLGEVVNQLLVNAKIKVDPKVMEEAAKIGPDPSKLNEGSKKVAKIGVTATAAVVAGQMVGSYFGNTIASFKGYKDESTLTKISRVVFPAVHSLTDWISEMKESKKSTISTVKQGVDNAFKDIDKKPSEKTNPKESQVSVYTGYNYDEAAKQLGLGTRPQNPTAENEWKKEVERNMNKIKKDTRAGGANHPSWYMRGLAKYLMATDLTWTGVKQYENPEKFALTCCIDVSLVLPIENYKLHPQVKSNNQILFQGLRGKNTGAYQYTEEDVFHYVTAMRSFIARWRYLAKIMSIVNTRDVQVPDLPKRMFESIFYLIGDAQRNDIIANKPNYTERMNSIAKDINTVALPGDTLISRWNYIADKALKDYNGPKPVYGIYCLKNVVAYDGNGQKMYEFDKSHTFISYINDLASDFNGWLHSNNGVYLKIAGDMMKLFGANKEAFANVPLLNGSEAIKYEYDAEAVDQLRSAKFFYNKQASLAFPSYDGVTPANYVMDLKSATSKCNWKDVLALGDNWFIISDRNKTLTSAENIQLTQFCFNMERTDGGAADAQNITVKIVDGTSTILEDMTIRYTSNINTDAGITVFGGFIGFNAAQNEIFVNTSNSTNTTLDVLSVLKQIDFLPNLQMYSGSSTVTQPDGTFVDIDNYALMSKKQFTQLNNVAVYSLTYVFSPDELKIMGLIG